MVMMEVGAQGGSRSMRLQSHTSRSNIFSRRRLIRERFNSLPLMYHWGGRCD
jgi:hypothetical protein